MSAGLTVGVAASGTVFGQCLDQVGIRIKNEDYLRAAGAATEGLIYFICAASDLKALEEVGIMLEGLGTEMVSAVCEERVDIVISKQLKQDFKDTLERCGSDTNMLQRELEKLLKDEPWFKESGIGKDGVNQIIKHFFVYNVDQPNRNPAIARYLGLSETKFSNTLIGVRNYYAASEKVVQQAIQQDTYKEMENGCTYYFVKSINPKEAINGEGVLVIKQIQTINGVTKSYFQSMMPSRLEHFLKQVM